MTLPTTHSTATLRTVNLSSEQPVTAMLSPGQFSLNGASTLRAVSVAGAPLQSVQSLQSVQYVNGGVDGNLLQGNLRYLVPVQRAQESYVLINQAPQMLNPVYLQNVQNVQNLQRLSVSSVEDTETYQQTNVNGRASSVFSQTSSPTKSPEPPEPEVVETSSVRSEIVNVDLKNHLRSEVRTEVVEPEPLAKLDTRFFGELLAEVYRKNCNIHSCISEHVSKIRGRKHLLDPTIDYKVEKEEIEALIPKGLSELTKQQIRYLLQTRMTADKTMRLLLATFSSLREELVHLQEDLRRLESEKEGLERDLMFKAEQAQQYDRLLEAVRENNRQLQNSLKETSSIQRNLETQLMSTRSIDSSKDFRMKELEGSKRALEQENELLRKKLEGQCSTSTLNTKTQELSRHYEQMLSTLREEKDKELKNMRSQLVKIQTEYSTERSSDKSLQLRITELLSTLEQRESVIKRQEEEIRRLQQEKVESSKNVTKTIITKRYRNQYPILGLLSDDYQVTSPVKEAKTIVIERTGEMIKQEIITTP
uniref:POF1B actin binding protein n=2 Tax=Astyanax mexicanus TaxID=7994 RepID=A0A8B9JSM1_ASTMX